MYVGPAGFLLTASFTRNDAVTRTCTVTVNTTPQVRPA